MPLTEELLAKLLGCDVKERGEGPGMEPSNQSTHPTSLLRSNGNRAGVVARPGRSEVTNDE